MKGQKRYILGSKTGDRVLTGMVEIGITFPISGGLLFFIFLSFYHFRLLTQACLGE